MATLTGLLLLAAAARAGEPLVRYERGLVSAAFSATPGAVALAAIQEATRATIVIPPALLEGRTVTLEATSLHLDLFLRRLLDGLGLGGYALVYEADGGPGRLTVVSRGAPGGAGPPDPGAAARREPVYIAPREPPAYIPPVVIPEYVPGPPARPVVRRPPRPRPPPGATFPAGSAGPQVPFGSAAP
jgi:hypothetical protein